MEKAINIRNLCKSFDQKIVLNHFSLDINKGDIVCIMGPSGKGKSTLLNILAGLQKADSGEISFFGGKGKISYLFQENRLCEDFNAVSNIILVTGKSVAEDKIREHLNELFLGEDLEKKVGDFSGGMKRRVAIARAMLFESDILLMDEPFKGLDENLREQVISYLLKYRNDRTCVIVTHDKRDAADLGASVVEL